MTLVGERRILSCLMAVTLAGARKRFEYQSARTHVVARHVCRPDEEGIVQLPRAHCRAHLGACCDSHSLFDLDR